MARNQNNSDQMRQLLQPEWSLRQRDESGDAGRRGASSSASSSASFSPSFSSTLSAASPSSPSASSSSATSDHSPTTNTSSAPFSRRALGLCTLDEMQKLPWRQSCLGKLMANLTHIVLIDVHEFNSKKVITPRNGQDIWSSDVVKMPHSPSNVMTAHKVLSQQMTDVSRWKVISKELKALANKKAVKVHDVERAILSYNQKYKAQWSFDALSIFAACVPETENYFDSLFPKIAELALKLPEYVKKAIPMLRQGHPASITLSQVQIACLLANAFFCTFPHRNTTSSRGEYYSFPTINFNSLFGNWSERKKEKLRAIMHYFKVVTDKDANIDGLVTFERRCLRREEMQGWESCDKTMPRMHVTSHGTIEKEGTGMLQVDFASSWIGGGVLSCGLLQEEILFLMNPELIVARLFTQRLTDNECLIVTGSQKFSCSSGYGDSFEWAGPYEDIVERDEWARRRRQVLAMDAQHYKQRREQYNRHSVLRELNKAYCGFKPTCPGEPDIATGKWGCGAFNGDPQLKAAIQMMAAARARRGLAFFTFMDENLKEELEKIYELLVTEEVTVGKLFEIVKDFCSGQRNRDGRLFDAIKEALKSSKSLL